MRIDMEIVVPETPLAVIVMDTFDRRPPTRSFRSEKLHIFYKPACLHKNFNGRVLSIQVFSGRAIWAVGVSLRMSTITSRDQLKPIRIGEN